MVRTLSLKELEAQFGREIIEPFAFNLTELGFFKPKFSVAPGPYGAARGPTSIVHVLDGQQSASFLVKGTHGLNEVRASWKASEMGWGPQIIAAKEPEGRWKRGTILEVYYPPHWALQQGAMPTNPVLFGHRLGRLVHEQITEGYFHMDSIEPHLFLLPTSSPLLIDWGRTFRNSNPTSTFIKDFVAFYHKCAVYHLILSKSAFEETLSALGYGEILCDIEQDLTCYERRLRWIF